MSALADMDRAVQDNHDRAQEPILTACGPVMSGEHAYTVAVASCLSEPCVTWTRVRALLSDIPNVDNLGRKP